MSFAQSGTVRLTESLLARPFKAAKVFREHEQTINSVSFDATGEFAITSSDEDAMRLFDMRFGLCAPKPILSKKYGCCLARFTHKTGDVIHASTKENNTIRYLSLHNGSYLRYFVGHETQVVQLEMNPLNEIFLSGAINEGIRIWDTRSPTCQGLLNMSAGSPVVCWHPNGVNFVVGVDNVCHFYDLASFDKGRCHFQWVLEADRSLPVQITSLSFSPCGKYLVAATAHGVTFVYATSDGSQVRRFGPPAGAAGRQQRDLLNSAHVTPDSRFVFAKRDDKVAVWSIESGRCVSAFGSGLDDCRIAMAPLSPVIATYDTDLTIWQPSQL